MAQQQAALKTRHSCMLLAGMTATQMTDAPEFNEKLLSSG
jgi:hypothetical protein